MDKDVDEGDTTVPKRPKAKRMSSIKKLGKMLGITSKKNTSKEETVGEEEQLASSEIDTKPKHGNTPSTPIAKILNRQSQSDSGNKSDARLSFRFKPKSFYRTSGESVNKDDPDMSPLPSAPLPRKHTNGSAELVPEATNVSDSTTGIKPLESASDNKSARPPTITIETCEACSSRTSSSFHSGNMRGDNNDDEASAATENCANSIATKSLRAALMETQVRLVKVLPSDMQALLNGDGSPSSPLQRVRSISRTREVFAINRPLTQSLDKLHFDYEKASINARRGSGSSSLSGSSNVPATAVERYNISSSTSRNSGGSEAGDTQFSEPEDPKIVRLRERQQQRVVLKSASDSTWNHKTRSIPTGSATARRSAYDGHKQAQAQPNAKEKDKGETDIISARSQSGGWNSSTKKVCTPAASHKKSSLQSDGDGSSNRGQITSSAKKMPGSTPKRTVPSVYGRPVPQKGARTPKAAPPVVTSKSLRSSSVSATPPTSATIGASRKAKTPSTAGRGPSGSVVNNHKGSRGRGPLELSSGKPRPTGMSNDGGLVEQVPRCPSDVATFSKLLKNEKKMHTTSAINSVSGKGGEDIPPPPISSDLSPIRPASNPFGDLIKKTPPRTDS